MEMNSTESQERSEDEVEEHEQSDYSDNDQPTNREVTKGSCEGYEIKSLDERQYQVTERKKDPEFEAKEEYMRKLMSFRKDELILPESSDDEIDANSDTKKNFNPGVEDAYELVETIDFKMN